MPTCGVPVGDGQKRTRTFLGSSGLVFSASVIVPYCAARAFRAEGRKPALRIKMPDEDIAFDDLIRGTIEFKAGSVPDYVIVRPNGDPLYTLTNPVDDAMMEVNVVLRGEDLLSSTPRQIVLYRYLWNSASPRRCRCSATCRT